MRKESSFKIGMINCKTNNKCCIRKPLTTLLDAMEREPNLDILLAPEWFLVSSTPREFYTPQEYSYIRGRLERATEGLDMLLIPGSIAHLDSEGKYRNTALVLSGGETLLEYSKRRDGGDKSFAQKQYKEWKPGDVDGVFQWRDYTGGVEICADHSCKTLISTCQQDFDLQIVVSCGMSLHDESISLRKGGLALLCDGFDPAQDIQQMRSRYAVQTSSLLTQKRLESMANLGEGKELLVYRVPKPGERRGLVERIRKTISL